MREGRWIALLVWGPAALKLKDREQWIGWNRALAAERLKLVVQNRRYLLLHDRGAEPNLASAALAAACRALPGQWQERFGYAPLIAEKRRPILPANQGQPTHAFAIRAHPGDRLPPFVQTACGHGRVEERAVSLCAAEPMATGFPFSRTIVKIRSTRTEKKSGRQSIEDRCYLSSQDSCERTPENWINLSRSHWAGVENRNHWRRDASLGEDRTRLQNPVALANLALLRSINLRLISTENGDDWLPAHKERLAAHPNSALALILQKL